ncbi:MAG TPA: DUF1622 domain-containing protein [Deltaproteobacteria bacterium]|jgi:uncharacterized membrane protein|nr:DUF1622 domain-containing protein [Deltaproteobacteria bacterium]HRR70642.1 DUF1622 domain-containing protein [Desulfomonilia bacterium]HNR51039.1 DUF1622 domain-containing protein [Deltaproteobacteria bacterium]HOE72048.1 DUF1622 domain-containing protein [Deltaproteobacteria bacterium]HON63210.1 DUF1622 domain-containing protein [Deltaproteobacteria bacterium]
MMREIEAILLQAALWIQIPIETAGVLIVAVGAFASMFRLLRFRIVPDPERFHRIRIFFARYLVLGLEFQLASDIIETAVSPGWEQIGRLAAIAVIRTFLNFFLVREMKDEEREYERERAQHGNKGD